MTCIRFHLKWCFFPKFVACILKTIWLKIALRHLEHPLTTHPYNSPINQVLWLLSPSYRSGHWEAKKWSHFPGNLAPRSHLQPPYCLCGTLLLTYKLLAPQSWRLIGPTVDWGVLQCPHLTPMASTGCGLLGALVSRAFPQGPVCPQRYVTSITKPSNLVKLFQQLPPPLTKVVKGIVDC